MKTRPLWKTSTARRWQRLMTYLAVFSLFSLTAQSVIAAVLTTPRIYMNRQKANQTTGQSFTVFFTTSSTGGIDGTNDEVRIIFPDGDDTEWCRTAGALGSAGIANPEGATETATPLPGTLSATCAQGSGSGAAESNSDRLLITGSTTLSNNTKYGVTITDDGGAGVTGTATPAANDIKVIVKTYEDGSTVEDTATLATSLIGDDQVVVTATVDPTLSVTVTGSGAVSLGTLSASNVNQGSITSTVITNANSGFVSLVKYDATLTAPGPYTIPAEGGNNSITAGTSEYGATSDDNSATDFATAISNSCATGTGPMGAEALTTTFQIFASESAATASDVTTLCFVATTSATQQPGTYTSTATLVTTARF